MKFELTCNSLTGAISSQGEITAHDMLRLNLDAFDKALVYGPCETSDDYLLVLEMLFRRFREQEL